MSSPSYTKELGAEGVGGRRTAALHLDDVSYPYQIPWDALPLADGTTLDASGDSATTLRRSLRYILIQPIGGDVEVRLGALTTGMLVADKERYPVPDMGVRSITLVDGPADVRIEIGL